MAVVERAVPERDRIETLPTGGAVGVPIGNAMPQCDPEVARYLTYYQPISPLGPALVTTPHDMTAQLDPITGDPVLVVAFELQGIRVYDARDPALPVELGAWRGEGMDAPLERVHTAAVFEWQGRRLAVGATETFARVPPALYIVDFTRWDRPEFVARWVPPGIEHDDGLAYSLHNWQFVGGRLYVTAFHAGLWVLDLADPARPQEVALRVPVHDAEYPWPGSGDVNRYWDVLVARGHVIVTDMAAGALRRDPESSRAAVTWGNVALSLALFPFIRHDPLLTRESLLGLLFLGVFQIGVAYAFFVKGLQHVTATQASLTGMLEPVANPIWVAIFLGERPSWYAVAGGVVVLAAIAWHTMMGEPATEMPAPD